MGQLHGTGRHFSGIRGDHIIDAASGIDPDTGGPQVNITLDGKGGLIFSRITGDEVGKRMATVFIETKTETVEENGELVNRKFTTEEVINAATIQSQLGKRFRITGLESTQEARNLSFLLRAGALAAPIEPGDLAAVSVLIVGNAWGDFTADEIEAVRQWVQAGGGLLLVPQFTLAADTNKGNRPSFTRAAPPDEGERLFDYLAVLAGRRFERVQTGVFGADMQVALVNDGPVTFWLES